jgi:hypothetical protein
MKTLDWFPPVRVASWPRGWWRNNDELNCIGTPAWARRCGTIPHGSPMWVSGSGGEVYCEKHAPPEAIAEEGVKVEESEEGMKVRELLERLGKVNPDLAVVVEIVFNDGDDVRQGGIMKVGVEARCDGELALYIKADESEAVEELGDDGLVGGP